MVFSAALLTTTTTGVSPLSQPAEAPAPIKVVDKVLPHDQAQLKIKANDKHDVTAYTLTNASFIGLAGLVTGLQEAFYKFEKMPPPVSRRTVAQAAQLFYIIGRKTLLGTAMGATFCYVEASMEQSRGVHDVYNGVAGGAAAGLLFAMMPYKPWPQPVAWPLFFGLSIAAADLVSEGIPYTMQGFRHWGPIAGRENWGDPEPPRPPILQTGASARPINKNFWRGE